jgi:hypothetical protein
MTLGFVLVAAAFLWLIAATVRSSDRKRFFGLTLLALVVGLITGFTAAWQWYIPELRATLGGRMRWLENEPLAATMVSYAALNKLESGKEAEARSFLAGQVASYYRQLKGAQQLSPDQKKILDIIESGAAKSETLKQKLQESASH